MPDPYSLDLRQKIVEVYQSEKLSLIKLATRFKISLSSVKRYITLDRTLGDLSPKIERKGRPGKMTDAGYAAIKQMIQKPPSITLKELSKGLYKKEKIKAGRSILSRACQKLEMRRKKLSRYAVEKQSDRIIKKTKTYWQEIKSVSVEDVIFIDGSGANLQMSALYGRGFKNSRIMSTVPFNRGNHLTLIGAIGYQKIEAALYGEWSANGNIFLNFIESALCPILRPGHVVIMDNVAFHQVDGVKKAIEKRGARLVYLPPYSPELNPIEPMWGKIKHYLRKASARTFQYFKKTIKTAFEMINRTDLQHWFKHCGYKAQ